MNLWHKEKLQEVSKAKQRKKLIEWLDGLGVKHITDATGWPVADGDVIRAKLGGTVTTRREPRINFA